MDMLATTQTLEDFGDHAAELVEQVRRTGRPITLLMGGQAAAVVQGVDEHRRLLNLAARASAEEGIRQGSEDNGAGRVRPAQEAFDLLRAEFGIPR